MSLQPLLDFKNQLRGQRSLELGIVLTDLLPFPDQLEDLLSPIKVVLQSIHFLLQLQIHLGFRTLAVMLRRLRVELNELNDLVEESQSLLERHVELLEEVHEVVDEAVVSVD
jgi:hypothetical protein